MMWTALLAALVGFAAMLALMVALGLLFNALERRAGGK